MLRSDSHFGVLGIRSSLYGHKTCHPGTTRTPSFLQLLSDPQAHIQAPCPLLPGYLVLICCGLVWEGLCPSPDYIGIHEAAQAVLDVTVIVLQLPECWDYRHELPAWFLCPICMGRQEEGLERNTVGSHTKVHLDTKLWGQGRLFLCHL